MQGVWVLRVAHPRVGEVAYVSEEQSARLKKLFQLCDEIGLERRDRLELAQVILRREITSFKQLDDVQVCRLLDAAEGYEKILWLLATQPLRHTRSEL